jgi:ATP-binding cassette, subfamily B, multidrug efflux pump
MRRQRSAASRPSIRHLGHLSRLLPYVKRYAPWLTIGLIGILITRFFEAMVPMFMKTAIDSLVIREPNLLLPVIGILGVVAARFVLSIFTSRVIRRVGIATSYDLRKRFYIHVQKMGPLFFNRFSTGDLMSRASGDIGMVRGVVAFGWVQVVTFVFSIAVGLSFMIYLSPSLTFWVLVPSPLVAIVGVFMSRRLFPLVRQQRLAMDDVTSFTQENLNGIRTVQAMAQEAREISRFREICTHFASMLFRTQRYRARMNLVMPFVSIISTLIILGYGGHLVLINEITIGTFTAFFSYMVMVTGPIGSIGNWLSMFTSAAAATERLFEVLDYEPEIADNPTGQAPAIIRGDITFQQFNYRFPDAGEVALKDISLQIQAGEMIACLGSVGGGKSTLLKTLVRLVEPPPGSVLVDGVDIRDYSLEQLRSQVALIPQDPFLFSMSIRENITYDEPDREEPPIRTAAQLAELLETIEAFPEKMDTLVGERGITLSGGQKQRATLARGLIREARILAMDDCFASVDTRTEEQILRRLKRVRQGLTTILISHRVSTARHADRIFVLESGRIIESGSHDELMARGGYYSNLEAIQSNQDRDRARKIALLKDLGIDVEEPAL